MQTRLDYLNLIQIVMSITEPPSKRRKVDDDALVAPSGFKLGLDGAMIKQSWECHDLVKRYTAENWKEEMPEDIQKCE